MKERKQQSTKNIILKNYLGYIVAFMIIGAIAATYGYAQNEDEYFFEDYTCPQLMYLNNTKNGLTLLEHELRLNELLETECETWILER